MQRLSSRAMSAFEAMWCFIYIATGLLFIFLMFLIALPFVFIDWGTTGQPLHLLSMSQAESDAPQSP